MVEGGTGSVRLLSLRDESDLVGVRRHVHELGERQGLTPLAIEALATAVTEIARNVLVHAESGTIRLSAAPARGGTGRAVVVEVADRGPGIADIEAALVDGFSTGTGLGLGLPGARRLVDVFDVQTVAGRGTTVRLEKWAE